MILMFPNSVLPDSASFIYTVEKIHTLIHLNQQNKPIILYMHHLEQYLRMPQPRYQIDILVNLWIKRHFPQHPSILRTMITCPILIIICQNIHGGSNEDTVPLKYIQYILTGKFWTTFYLSGILLCVLWQAS